MPTLAPAQENRSESRLKLRKPVDLKVTLERIGEDGSTSFPVVAADISSKGIKLIVTTSLEFNARVTVKIQSEHFGISKDCVGEVRWIRPAGVDETWAVGCLFEQPLEEEDIEKLCVAGGFERRGTERVILNTLAYIQHASSIDRHPVTVVDASESGLRLVGNRVLQPGESIKLHLEFGNTEFFVFAQVVWQCLMDGKRFAGCRLELSENAENYRRWRQIRQRSAISLWQRYRSPVVIAASILTTILAGRLFG